MSKHYPIKNRMGGDILEVTVKDVNMNMFYREQSDTRNKSGLKKIIDDLKNFGIDLLRAGNIKKE